MPSVRDVALPLASICTTVPAAAPGICQRCHNCPSPGWSLCWSCERVEAQLSKPCPLVVPLSLYEVSYQLHYQLRNYKGDNPDLARDFTIKTAALLGYFLQLHGSCIAAAAGGTWDVITSVPSSTADRVGKHPLVTAITLVPQLRQEYEDLLQRGSAEVTHTVASDDGFVARRRLTGERILSIDDTFTSGARAQSAASVLNSAGGEVIAIVPIGRVITPGFAPHVAEYWKRQTQSVFSFDDCCIGSHPHL